MISRVIGNSGQAISLAEKESDLEQELHDAHEAAILKLKEYNHLLETIKDKETAQKATDRAVAIDREDDSNRQKIEELLQKRNDLRESKYETQRQLGATRTWMVRMLETKADRELVQKSFEAMHRVDQMLDKSVDLSGTLGGYEGAIASDQARICKLMDDSWPKKMDPSDEIEIEGQA